MQNARERIAAWLLVASLVISAYIAWKVTDMPERPELAGQSIESLTAEGPIITERYARESLEEWRLRHEQAVQAAGGLAKR